VGGDGVEVEVVGRHRRATPCGEGGGEHREQRPVGGIDPLEQLEGDVGRRGVVAPQLLGQGAQQGGHQLQAAARHLPVQPGPGHLVE
jgi:hypothetical protein